MQFHRSSYEPTAYDDDGEDIPASGPIAKWIGGVIAPLMLAIYGIACVATHHAIIGWQMPLELFAARAVMAGIAAMSAGLFLHCHYFWGNIYHLSPWAVLGKILSLIGFIGSIGYLLVRVGIFGEN